MTNPTSNFGWQMPTSTDLVTDLPADFETFGQAVDTSLADLKGGTTGQVLSKASNTDMDFTWVAQDDSNAIQNAIVDAKGDLIAASAADTPARLAVGNNGETLVADSSTTTGLRYQGNFAAGKNKIINGDFGIWQRGTSFSGATYNADRWVVLTDATVTTSQQAFTAGTAPVAGYESQYFQRTAKSAGGTYGYQEQRIEDVRTFAGQTVTLSFWAKADAAITYAPQLGQYFGTGGSVGTNATVANVTLTTSWARYSVTISVPSISGKTIGAGNYLYIRTIGVVSSSAYTIDIWGVQLEAGSVATAFQTATGTIQGETSACQRYYYRLTADTTYAYLAFGMATSTTNGKVSIPAPSTMRVVPTAIDSPTASTLRFTDGVTGTTCNSSPTLDGDTTNELLTFNVGVASGLTQYRPIWFGANNSASAYIGFSAEL